MLAHMIYIAIALLLLQTVDHPVDSTAKDVSPPKLTTKTDQSCSSLTFRVTWPRVCRQMIVKDDLPA